jgi:hypothetical protein
MAILKTGTTVGGQEVVVSLNTESFSTSASSNTFTLNRSTSAANIFVTVGGLLQIPVTNYIVSGSTLQLANLEPLSASVPVEVKHLVKG